MRIKLEKVWMMWTTVVLLLLISNTIFAVDVLKDWNNTPSKQAIIQYVDEVTNAQSSKYIKPVDRIAVFDNDGTVQLEKPYAFIDMFALVRIRDLALNNPEQLTKRYSGWKNDATIQELIKTPENELYELLPKMKYEDLVRIFKLANGNGTQAEQDKALADYVHNYSHIRFHKPPVEMVYKPMVELIQYLKKNGFTVYFVSGSTTDYLRQFSENVGIAKNNVIGWEFLSEVKYDKDGLMYIQKIPESIDPVSNKEGKPVNIARYIGRRPVFAAGNSSGDIAMLTYVHENKLPSFCLIVLHTDADREYRYDFGQSVRNAAKKQGWIIIDMKKDFKVIF
jgi:phosphoglycolate phosphatase-like HAD superfamily hydrolase